MSQMTMPTEDSKQIEDEVMAELRSALDVHEIQPPTSMITIPKVVKSPQEGSTEGTDEGSFEDGEKETLVKVKDGSPKRTSNISLDGSAMNDSFMMRLSSNTSLGGSSAAVSESSSQRFYIGTVREEGEDGTVQSHDSNLGTDDMSHDELIDIVHRLYGQLKKVDDAVAKERKRRHSREKNLIKLATELGKRKDAANMLLSKIEEMREELRMTSSEKELLEQRLEKQKRASNEIRAASQEQAQQEIREITVKYDRTIADYDERIGELNKTHARQCEQLCREVVEANQEVMRLQKVLSEMTRGAYPVDRTFVSTVSRDEPAKLMSKTTKSKSARSRGPDIYTLILLALGAVVLGHKLHTLGPTIYDWLTQIGTSDGDMLLKSVDILIDDTDVDPGPSTVDQNVLERQAPIPPTDNDYRFLTESEITASKPMTVAELLSQSYVRAVFFDARIPLKWLRTRIVALLDFWKVRVGKLGENKTERK